MAKLLLQSLLGLAFLLGVLATALFWPAGTTDYWQAWLYLALFGGSSGLITVYLLRFDQALLARRIQAGPTAEASPIQKLIQSLAGLSFIALFVVAGYGHRLGSGLPLGFSLAGAGLMLLGFWIVFRVFRANSFTSATIEVAEQQRVIDTGPYARVRHPMYAGAALLLAGSALELGALAALLPVALLMAVIVWRLRDEERYLAEHLPGYEAYCRRVRFRLIPGLW